MSDPPKSSFFHRKIDVLDIEILHHGEKLVSGNWDIPRRNMPYWYFYWNETAGAELKFQDRNLYLLPEKIVLIPPHTTFTAKFHKPFRHMWIHFFAGAPFDRIKRREILFSAQDYLPLLHFSAVNQTHLALKYYSLIYALLLKLPPDAFLEKHENAVDPRIYKAMQLMTGNDACSKSGLQAISCKVGMSLSNFHRLFKKGTGLSPQRYFLNMRLENARHMLMFDDFSIAEIAEKNGFADRYHFSKAFKTVYKIPPVAYRKAHYHSANE